MEETKMRSPNLRATSELDRDSLGTHMVEGGSGGWGGGKIRRSHTASGPVSCQNGRFLFFRR